MRVALYARVSTESQQARGTIGSQLAVLRERVGAEGDEVVAEFCDDGHSGARLDRPGLDALRDAAEAWLLERVWCLSPDRLARVYAYQVIVLDELARHGVGVRFTDAPPLDDDPQARLLTQVQGVIAEYERAKIAERYRRGKLFRSRAGEVLAGAPPTATGASPVTPTARHDSRYSNPRPRSSGGSSPTPPTAGTRCARSSAGWPPTGYRPGPAATDSGAPPR
ncbi:MAG TPA: recombinase family protein [Pseudonocardiaceae bacterium]|jgi:site-specific DNA recombinase|nr:recombinase family protein [Pseudonocardiaceae bacterium]